MVIILNNLGTIYIFTNRCILRRFEMNDSYSVFNSYTSNEEVAKYLNNNAHKKIYETEFMISEFKKNYNNLNYYNWIIINQYNNNVIGTISLHEVDIFNEKAEIGIIIAPKFQKKGYAKEVLNAVIDFAFNKLRIHRLEAKIMKDNIPSNNLFKELNFKFEAIIHSLIKKNNNFFDVNLYYLINNRE